MNIKTLLVSSAAAFAAVSSAHAADAIVAAAPEPVEYVRVCDAFGTGYFYIPGTETCLKISGYVRFQADWSSFNRGAGLKDFDWDARTRGLVTFNANTDTELGALKSVITMRTWANGDGTQNSLDLDEAYITLGGFRAGYGYNYWDNDLSGETDDLGSNRINQVGYEYKNDSFSAGFFVDELTKTYSNLFPAWYNGNDNVGFEAQVSGKFGPVEAFLLGSYDVAAENGAVRLLATADIGPGTFGIAGIYSSGANAYYDLAEWTVATEYAVKINDKFSVTPGFQYWWNTGVNGNGDFTNGDAWKAGLTVDYKITSGLTSKVSVQYQEGDNQVDTWSGFFRLQRTF